MPAPRTTVWTDGTGVIAVLATIAAGTGAAAMQLPSWMPLISLLVLIGTVITSLAFDGFAGLVVGLVSAGVTVIAAKALDVWTTSFFGVFILFIGGVLAAGWVAGVVGGRPVRIVRQRREIVPDLTNLDVVEPVAGSLGLLSKSDMLTRLDEEIERARRYRRGINLLVIDMRPRRCADGERPDEAALDNARRAVARLIENLVRTTDVPFALSASEVGAILPESDRDEGWQAVGRLLDAAARATFKPTEGAARSAVGDWLELDAHVRFLEDDVTDAATFLNRVRTATAVQS